MKHLIVSVAACLAVAGPSLSLPAFADIESATRTAETIIDTTARTDIGEALDTFLASDGDALLLQPDALDKDKLDFSMESLTAIDSWLNAIYEANRLEAVDSVVGETFMLDGRGDNSVIFAGLYLGEVIRQNAEQDWSWQPFDVFMSNNPAHAEYFGPSAGFDEYVLVSNQGVATPINAALKRVLNGPIDSVHYIATFLSAPIDIDKALTPASAN